MSVTTATNGTKSNSSYQDRKIDVTITLATGKFGTTGFNTVKLSGLRATASIVKYAFPGMDHGEIRVYGVQPSIMNQVSTLGIPIGMVRPLNAVLVEAGDPVNGMATVFSGYMNAAWVDFSGAPDTFLNIISYGGLAAAIQPVPPISIPNGADAATLLAGIANRMLWGFENNGVVVQLGPSYFPGTALEQAHAIARQANIELYPDTGLPVSQQPGSGTLAIWPKTGRRGGVAPLVSAATGMVGYPKFQSNGMSVRSLFNPSFSANPSTKIGGAVMVQSTAGNTAPPEGASAMADVQSMAGASSGLWYVVGPLSYDLSAQISGGPWFVDMNLVRLPGTPPP